MEVVQQEKDTKPSQLDDILNEKLKKAFHEQTSTLSLHDIAKIAVEHSPIDLAYAVYNLPPHARPVLYDNLPGIEAKINFVINTDSDTRIRIFRYMSDAELRELFNKMATNEAVEVLEDMSERRFRRVMELIDPKKAFKIRDLKKHSRNSVGRLMTNEFFAFTMETKLGEVANYIRNNPRIDFTRGIYVLGEDRELQGFVPGRNLIINGAELPLKQVMRPILHKVTTETTREEVVDIVERYKISSLPVVDKNNRLIGVVANEDVIEIMEDLADETIAQIAGTSEKLPLKKSIAKRFWARFPWLFVTLIAGLINVCVISSFIKDHSSFLTFVLFFIPLITGMSGNIGIQCSTVLVRSMAIGAFSASSKKALLTRELLISLVTGLVFGFGSGILIFLLHFFGNVDFGINSVILGVIIGTGLLGACFAGAFLGVMSPIFFARIGIDPAISSGPIVTALNDVLAMSIFFLIALGLCHVFLM